MKVTLKLNELLDADPRFVSLVKRGANRTPIRIVKTEKGEVNMGGIDLSKASRLFTAKGLVAPGTVSGIVVVKDDKNFEAVKKAVDEAGFKTDNVLDLESGAVMFVQSDEPEKDAHVVRLSEHALITVKNFGSFAKTLADNYSFMGDEAKKQEFFLGTDIVGKAMSHTLSSVMATDPETAQKSLKEINTYLDTLTKGVPVAAFKLDKALAEIFKAAPKDPEDDAEGGDGGADEASEMPDGYDKKKWDAMSSKDRVAACKEAKDAATAAATKKAEDDAAALKVAEEAKEKAKKDGGSMQVDGHLEMPANTDKAVWDLMSEDLRKQYAMAAAKVVAPQTSSPSIESLVSNAVKAATDTLKAELEAKYKGELDGMATMIKNLTLAVEGVTKNYKDLTTQLGLTVEKTEKLEATVKGTVTAPAPQENEGVVWDPTKKSAYGDDFIVDTAMQGKRQKYERAAA